MVNKFKEICWKIQDKIVTSVTMPWTLYKSIKSIDAMGIFSKPSVQWLMYLLSYLMIMLFGLTWPTFIMAIIFSYIIMTINVKYNFYYVAYACLKGEQDKK